MARIYATIPPSLWREKSFVSLEVASQLTYLMLLSQRDLDAGGILPMRERRWAEMINLPVTQVQAALVELEIAGWVYGDDVQQETFVSGFFEFEDIHKQPRRVVAAREAIGRLRSRRIAAVATVELDALAAGVTLKAPRGQRAVILERDGYRCQVCGWAPGDPVPVKRGTDRPVFRVLEIDHIWPKSKGGADEADNFQVLCTTCNCRKGARV